MHRRPSPALILAIVAVVLASTGSAVAAGLITSARIANGTIQLVDISKKAQKSLKGKAGAAGKNGLNGANGAPGAPGAPGSARAYARVTAFPGPDATLDMARTKGFTAMTRSASYNYVYCLTPAPGIDPATMPALVSVDWFGTTDPVGNASASWAAQDYPVTACGAGKYAIVTQRLTPPATQAVYANDVGFEVVVP